MQIKVSRVDGPYVELEVEDDVTAVVVAMTSAVVLGCNVFGAPWCLAWPAKGYDGRGLDWLESGRPVRDLPTKDVILGILPLVRALWN